MLLSGYQTGFHKGSGDNGAKDQAKTQQQAIALQREQWNTTMGNLQPYMQVGAPALQSLQNLSTLGGQASALNDYYNSDQYKMLADQARYAQLSSAEAMGGMGNSAVANQLSTIAPQLGQNWLSGQMQNYSNLMNVGMNAATGQASAGQNYANNTSSLLQGLGQINAAGSQKGPSKAAGALTGAASGAAMGTAIMPGWGTAIGAGVGALASLF
ncbi:MAG: DNA transfer protein [Mesorhizobium sp.]|nr:MAG: DNA transfer protein [Mesorhizobium sp.]